MSCTVSLCALQLLPFASVAFACFMQSLAARNQHARAALLRRTMHGTGGVDGHCGCGSSSCRMQLSTAVCSRPSFSLWLSNFWSSSDRLVICSLLPDRDPLFRPPFAATRLSTQYKSRNNREKFPPIKHAETVIDRDTVTVTVASRQLPSEQ